MKERSQQGKLSYRLKDLKKVEDMILAASDIGEFSTTVTVYNISNFIDHYEFIAENLRGRGFIVNVVLVKNCPKLKIHWDLPQS